MQLRFLSSPWDCFFLLPSLVSLCKKTWFIYLFIYSYLFILRHAHKFITGGYSFILNPPIAVHHKHIQLKKCIWTKLCTRVFLLLLFRLRRVQNIYVHHVNTVHIRTIFAYCFQWLSKKAHEFLRRWRDSSEFRRQAMESELGASFLLRGRAPNSHAHHLTISRCWTISCEEPLIWETPTGFFVFYMYLNSQHRSCAQAKASS